MPCCRVAVALRDDCFAGGRRTVPDGGGGYGFPFLLKELQQVEVLYSIALLQQGVEREKITGVGIFYLRERAI